MRSRRPRGRRRRRASASSATPKAVWRDRVTGAGIHVRALLVVGAGNGSGAPLKRCDGRSCYALSAAIRCRSSRCSAGLSVRRSASWSAWRASVETAQPPQQLAPRGVVEVVAGQPIGQGLDLGHRGLRSAQLGQSQRTVECHHRRRLDGVQPIVQGHDLGPIGLVVRTGRRHAPPRSPPAAGRDRPGRCAAPARPAPPPR